MVDLVPRFSDLPAKTAEDAQQYPVCRVVIMNPVQSQHFPRQVAKTIKNYPYVPKKSETSVRLLR